MLFKLWERPLLSPGLITVRRLSSAIFLILALIVSSLAPAQAGWFCADGVPCAIAMARARKSSPAVHDCCHVSAKPGPAALTGGDAARGLQVQAARTCRYRNQAEPDRAQLGSVQTAWALAAVDSALPAQSIRIQLPAAHTACWAPNPDGYHPPPLVRAAPGRAPPVV